MHKHCFIVYIFCTGKIFGLKPCEHRALRLNNFVIEYNTIIYRENV